MKSNTKLNQLLEQIAQQHLFIDTLETQSSDRLDFHDVSVWAVKAALQAAYEAGLKAAETNTTPIHTQS
ncbi:MAG: hypothetical protein EBS54_08470 [Betaproteobacteria bacterium]|jgi:hypothetical protein|nr:hypothetical protein [Betaproteobacteria bacterium]NBT06728.1 hypothetical protein [Betaproteobacteria bacterium]